MFGHKILAAAAAAAKDQRMTPAEELALVETLLRNAATNGGVAEWQEGAHRAKTYSIPQLLAWRQDVQNRIVQEGSPLTMPVREVNL